MAKTQTPTNSKVTKTMGTAMATALEFGVTALGTKLCALLYRQKPLLVINHRRACAARVTVVVLCVCVCPRPSSATRATKRQTRHTGGLSIVLASV